jgi:hypothetical protein
MEGIKDKVVVIVATSEDVRDQPKAADAASELLQDVFGKDKSPCGLVYGVASLPLGTPVELEIIFELGGRELESRRWKVEWSEQGWAKRVTRQRFDSAFCRCNALTIQRFNDSTLQRFNAPRRQTGPNVVRKCGN